MGNHELLPKEISSREYVVLQSAIDRNIARDKVSEFYELDNKKEMDVYSQGNPPSSTMIFRNSSEGKGPALTYEDLFKSGGLKQLTLIFKVNDDIVAYNVHLKDKKIVPEKGDGITKKIQGTLESIINSMKDAGFKEWKLDLPADIKYYDQIDES